MLIYRAVLSLCNPVAEEGLHVFRQILVDILRYKRLVVIGEPCSFAEHFPLERIAQDSSVEPPGGLAHDDRDAWVARGVCCGRVPH